MSGRRTLGASGPNPISFLEIEAYMRLTGLEIDDAGFAVLEAIDGVYIKVAYAKSNSGTPGMWTP